MDIDPMWFPVALVALILGLFVRRASASGGEVMDTKDPNVKLWEPYVRIAARNRGIPWQFAMTWLAGESSGRACAVGNPKASGPDGFPKEMGIFQLYNPDDLEHFGTSGEEMRAFCVPTEPGKPHSNKLARPLTPVEMERQVELGMALIKRSEAVASKAMAQSSITWTGRDYWRATKLYHALPTIVKPGFAKVAEKLGRAPATWMEFRKVYEVVNPNAMFKPGLPYKDQHRDWRSLENAEKTGNSVPESGFPQV